jgi:hypothetical protein
MFQFNSAGEKKNDKRRTAKVQRTRIEDISAIGEVLSEEHLRGVAGGECPLHVGGNGFRSSWCTGGGDVGYDI